MDLDFFTTKSFALEALLQETGFPQDPTVLGRSAGSLALECGGVKVEFLQHRYPLLAPIEQVGVVRLLSLADVTAMKLNAIANRGSKRDFFGLVRILDSSPPHSTDALAIPDNDPSLFHRPPKPIVLP